MEPNRFLSLWVSLLMATLAMLCPQMICAAGATSTEINNAIVQEGSIPLTWENDATYPWLIINGKIQSGNAGAANSESVISFTYSSQYPTTINFSHKNLYDSQQEHFYVYVDDVEWNHTKYTSSTYNRELRLPRGNHKVSFKAKFDGTDYNALKQFGCQVWGVKVSEQPGASIQEINSTIVSEESIPLTWTLDNEYPWRIIDGKLQSNNNGFSNSESEISFTYSSQYPTTINFSHKNLYDSQQEHFYVYVDDVEWNHTKYTNSIYNRELRLPRGNHKVSFKAKFDGTDYNALKQFGCQVWGVKVSEQPGASIQEINSTIVSEESIPLTWTLDNEYPWRIIDGKLQSNNNGFSNSESEISFTYSSQYPTTINFSHKNLYDSQQEHFYVYVDDVEWNHTKYTNSIYNRELRLSKGTHKIAFKAIFEGTDYNLLRQFGCQVWGIKVTAPVCATSEELNSKLLSTGSLPIVWEQDTIFPLGYGGEFLQTTNSMWENTKSSLKAQVNFEKPSVISFDWRVGYDDYQGNHIAKFYVDGVLKYSNSRNTSWARNTVALSAGEHTLHWEYSSTTTGANYWMQLKDLSISSNWVEVESSPGLLGVETLYKVNKLQDVNFLKVKGGMNDADWQVIKQMVNLYGLDLSEANITTIPASFNSNANFGYMVLPETLQSISEKAFTTCNIHSITIPASVVSIGNEAFSSTTLGYIDFAPNSKLQTIGTKAFYATRIEDINIPASVVTIGNDAFYKSKLINVGFENNSNLTTIGENAFRECKSLVEVVMPNTVTSVGKYAFADCSTLTKIHFSDAITALNEYTCANCNKVEVLHLPQNIVSIGRNFIYGANKVQDLVLPESLTSIGQDAFAGLHSVEHLILPDKLRTIGSGAFHNSGKLKIVELPSGVSSYNQTFIGCDKIETIVCRAATPPTVATDAFNAINKANVTLKVPSFSIATYKLDSYWYQFGEIIEGDPTDYCRIIGDLKLLNNRRMEGKPDVDLYYGGKLTVKGDAAMPMGKFDIYTSEGNPSSFITDCTNITADEINTIFSVSANKWHFLTPMVDVDLQQVIVSGTTNYVFRYYDGAARADIGAGTSWKNVSDMKLKAGVGYIFQCDAAGTLTFPVPVSLHKNILTTGAVTLPLTPHPSDNKANKGWNYVGNPFPSYFDIHYMDFTAPITVWNGSTYKAYSITDDNFVLRPMQGFFVQKPDAVDNIVLQAAGRQIESTVNRPNHVATLSRASSENERFIFNIEIASDTLSDATRIVLNDKASTGYELERDASKFMSMNESVPQIYSIDNDGNRLAINERPATNGEIALGVYIPDGNVNYSISASRIEGEAYLYDSEMRITHNFADGDYQFSAEQGTNNNRFFITLKGDVSSSIDTVADGNIVEISTVEDGIEICGVSDKAIKVVTLEGIIIYSAKLSETTVNIPLPSGIYIVNVENQSYKVIVK